MAQYTEQHTFLESKPGAYKTKFLPYDIFVFLFLSFGIFPLAVHDWSVNIGRGKCVGFIQQWYDAEENGSEKDKKTSVS